MRRRRKRYHSQDEMGHISLYGSIHTVNFPWLIDKNRQIANMPVSSHVNDAQRTLLNNLIPF